MNERERRLARRIGDAVRQNRRQLGWSQADLAEEADISVDHVGMLERGMRLPAVPLLVNLSEIFAVPVDSLISGEETDVLMQTVALVRSIPVGQIPTVQAMLRGLLAAEKPKRGPQRKRLLHN